MGNGMSKTNEKPTIDLIEFLSKVIKQTEIRKEQSAVTDYSRSNQN